MHFIGKICKPHSNIDIYPSTLVFVENIGHKYDFQGVGCSLVGSAGGGYPNTPTTTTPPPTHPPHEPPHPWRKKW